MSKTENFREISTFILFIALVLFSKAMKNRRFFKIFLIYKIIQFEMFFLMLCNNLKCDT